MPKTKILIVDDSAVVREAVAVMLEDRGFDVVAVSSVFSFAQTLNGERPDLVLVDVNMPAMNGDLLVRITQKHYETKCPIVLFSDKSTEDLSRLVKECGAAGYIQKTGNGQVLAEAIGKYLTKGAK